MMMQYNSCTLCVHICADFSFSVVLYISIIATQTNLSLNLLMEKFISNKYYKLPMKFINRINR